MSTGFKGKKLIHIVDIPVGHIHLYGRFSEVALGLAFLRVASVYMWIPTEKSLFLFRSLKVVVYPYCYCLVYRKRREEKMKLSNH